MDMLVGAILVVFVFMGAARPIRKPTSPLLCQSAKTEWGDATILKGNNGKMMPTFVIFGTLCVFVQFNSANV